MSAMFLRVNQRVLLTLPLQQHSAALRFKSNHFPRRSFYTIPRLLGSSSPAKNDDFVSNNADFVSIMKAQFGEGDAAEDQKKRASSSSVEGKQGNDMREHTPRITDGITGANPETGDEPPPPEVLQEMLKALESHKDNTRAFFPHSDGMATLDPDSSEALEALQRTANQQKVQRGDGNTKGDTTATTTTIDVAQYIPDINPATVRALQEILEIPTSQDNAASDDPDVMIEELKEMTRLLEADEKVMEALKVLDRQGEIDGLMKTMKVFVQRKEIEQRERQQAARRIFSLP